MVVQCSVPVLFNLASSVLYSFCSRFLVDRGRLVAFGLCVGCWLVPVRSLELELGLDAGSCTRSWTGCTFQWYWRKKKGCAGLLEAEMGNLLHDWYICQYCLEHVQHLAVKKTALPTVQREWCI